MPDAEKQPTDQELERELGWAPEVEPTEAEAPAPVEAAKPAAVSTPLPTPAAPVPDTLAGARAQLRSQQVQVSIAQAAQEYQRALVAQGMDPDQAQQQSETAAREYWTKFQQEDALNQANDAVKQALIKDLSREYGVPAEMLAGFSDPASMRAAATLYGAQAKELAGLKAKVEAPKAPVQSFDGGAGASGGVVQARRNDYAQGKGKALNAAEFEALHGYRPI